MQLERELLIADGKVSQNSSSAYVVIRDQERGLIEVQMTHITIDGSLIIASRKPAADARIDVSDLELLESTC